ncbi:DUF2300 domain-containing protein [Janthinobacterium lividum]|uniref:DUF2300 domain-containing protein n=1 Tax=Janthinobacterium lividum TaxID=29581 RepID=UPI0008934167|nr:DUF2300 domain-containing protein [Janthinobacterium lividum]MCC7716237.1 DUF2300 domain-containing protein [Janthinobacterium lividum]OEZ64923.1 hypothetical protein JANLI_05900 [Janthinobacterium lividum]WQE28831.1 DUF2300 domain-containing protein [Janthinobacterium lividum]STQ99787.1 Predicted secreted protein [Janthinobacterium lividum]
MRVVLPALMATLLLAAPARSASLDVAWWRDGKTEVRQLRQGGTAPPPFDGARQVPLASLWKLFVYVYASDSKVAMPDYRCGGRDPEEVYCCDAGQSIGHDAALAQSCGLFFSPRRLMIAPASWRQYWTGRLGSAPTGDFAWLSDPAQLAPARMVRLDSLLRALGSIPAASRADAEAALLRVVLDGRGFGAARWFGSQLRVKTYSWHEQRWAEERIGGAAGWLADGTPIWFGGAGGSSNVFAQWAPRLAASLPPVGAADDGGCVVVDYFKRYPIRAVRGERGVAAPGPLNGRYHVQFENGQNLALRSTGELMLLQEKGGRPQLRGRFGVNEYVARVLDREANAGEPEAAKALAIAARTYLQQNAVTVAGCQQIADSSATQRVSPSPATPAALAIARWTDQLIVDGVTVRYHTNLPSEGTMAWSEAVRQAKQGKHYDELLAAAYPGGALSTFGNTGARCQRLAQNEDWLARSVPRWQRVLLREAGYEAPPQAPLVCALQSGAPYSEQSRNRIFMRPLATREDRITLAHEYLHLGLRRHPRGQDEEYVERLARRLVDLNLEAL